MKKIAIDHVSILSDGRKNFGPDVFENKGKSSCADFVIGWQDREMAVLASKLGAAN
jgi:hypothetical protein